MRSVKWAAPAALVSAVLALSACGGGNLASTPGSGMGQLGAQRVAGEKHITAQMVKSNAACPVNNNLGCFSDSLANGAQVTWCYGPSSDPCEDTNTITWSGGMKLYKTNHPIGKAKIKATWSGPFQCTSSTCGSSGTYELDTLKNGGKLTATNKYKYAQDLCIDSSCGSYQMGWNVTTP